MPPRIEECPRVYGLAHFCSMCVPTIVGAQGQLTTLLPFRRRVSLLRTLARFVQHETRLLVFSATSLERFSKQYYILSQIAQRTA